MTISMRVTAVIFANRRERIAVGIAVAGTLISIAYTVRYGPHHPTLIYLGGLWGGLALWLRPSLMLRQSMGEIFQAAKDGQLPKKTAVQHFLGLGGLALFVLAITFWIKIVGAT